MDDIVYFGTANGATVTDGCACYNNNGTQFCSECYHYGREHVNCAFADIPLRELKPFAWDARSRRFVLKV